jgi:putative transposase
MRGGVTAPRHIVPGETYLITRRCTRREYLLRPDEETNAIFAYCLAEAAKRHGVGLVAWCLMSNHYHAVVHDPKGRLPAFLEQFHKMVAKVMNARWERSENFWSTEETCVTRLVTNHDIFEKVIYVLCNPVAADLVDRLEDWPGLSSLAFLSKKTRTDRRPKLYFQEDGAMPEVAELRSMVPSRITKNEAAASWWERVRKGVRERVETLRQLRIKENRRVMGRKAVLRMPHTAAPTTESAKGGLRPCIACKDPKRRKLELSALKEFRANYAAARLRLAAADRRAVFPWGTYRMRELGLRCAPPPIAA